MPRLPAILGAFRITLKVLVAINLMFGVAVIMGFAASLLAPDAFMGLFVPSDASPAIGQGMRLLMAVGIASVPLSHVILAGLIALVDSVRAGDPFVMGNASHLGRMAWALLGLEVLHLVGIIAAIHGSDGGYRIDWSFSFTGWLAVLLLFVLARVFEHGARMREDLEGTV